MKKSSPRKMIGVNTETYKRVRDYCDARALKIAKWVEKILNDAVK
jgi:hypothetical protein